MHPDTTHAAESLLVAALLQLAIIVLAARAANIAARACGQPGAVGEIVAGLLLGPSCLGAIAPAFSHSLFLGPSSASLLIISQVGLTLLMFQIGSEFAFDHLAAAGARRTVLAIATASILAPLLGGIALALVTIPRLAQGYDTLSYALFIGVAMAITAVPILGRILNEFALTRTPIGVITIAAAALNDVTCWLLLAAISAFATSHLTAGDMATKLFGTLAFAAALRLIGRPATTWLLSRHTIAHGRIPPSLMAIILATIFLCGILTAKLGIFVIFGGFAIGVLFCGHDTFIAAWRHQVGQFVLVFFLPIFFTFTGLRTNILGLTTASDWGWCCLFLLVGVASKIIPVTIAARLRGMSHADSFVCGALMNTRALMELIVLNVGLDLGVLPRKVFTMLVIMAVTSTIMTAPLLRAAFRRAGYVVPVGIEA